MIKTTSDYFQYLPLTPEMRRWGLAVTASGRTHIAAGSEYPPKQHPGDHQLDWEHGRVLDALQVVLISSGCGLLETRAIGQCQVEAGMVFLLLPNTWHRYRPDPKIGWTESWIELQGPVVNELLATKNFPPTTILRNGAIDIGMEDAMEAIHRINRQGSIDFQPEVSAAAMQVLALCSRIPRNLLRSSPIQQAVHHALRYLGKHHAEPVNVELLAEQLGVAYSHFRRAFNAQTGFSPWKYVIHLRLTRARRILASGDTKLDDIAAQVGFSSGFHLSHAFKKAYGESPDKWRRDLLKSRE